MEVAPSKDKFLTVFSAVKLTILVLKEFLVSNWRLKVTLAKNILTFVLGRIMVG